MNTPTSPFKFLDSYAKDDREVYFGHGRETEEVYSRIFQSRLLLVYGLSGTGKSSLIQCGLGNRLNDSDWLPINIRRAEDIMASLGRALQRHALSPAEAAPSKVDGKAVKRAIRSLYLDHFKPIYLIFDQFEELFIFGTPEERAQFADLVASVLASDLQCRFIFVIREEYLAGLTEFEADVPELFSNRIRIEKMTRAQAREAIEGPCQVAGIGLEDGFADALLQRISPERNEVELTYLQVYLDRLWRMATDGGAQPHFTLAMLDEAGSITDLLGAFLEEQVAEMPDPQHALALLKAFVSTRGTKRQNTLEETQAHARTLGTDIGTDEVLALTERFVSLRILRDKDDNGRYELRHDALAAKVYEKITLVEKELLEVRQFVENAFQTFKLRGIRLTAQDLEFVAPYRDRLFLPAEQEAFFEECRTELEAGRKLKRRVNIASLIGLMALISATAYYFYQESTRSRSHELAALSLLELEDDPALGFLLAEKAYGVEQTKLAERALINAFHNGPYLFEVNGFDPVVSDDGKYVLTINPIEGFRMESSIDGVRFDQDSSLTLWNSRGDSVARIGPFERPIQSAGFLEGQHRVYVWTTDTVLHVADTSGKLIFSKKVDRYRQTWSRMPQCDGNILMLVWKKPDTKDITFVWTGDLRSGISGVFEVTREVPEGLSYSEHVVNGRVVIIDGNKIRTYSPDGKQSASFQTFSFVPKSQSMFSPTVQNFTGVYCGKLLSISYEDKVIRLHDLDGVLQYSRTWRTDSKMLKFKDDFFLTTTESAIEINNLEGQSSLYVKSSPLGFRWFRNGASYYVHTNQFFAGDRICDKKLLVNFDSERPFGDETSGSKPTNKALLYCFGEGAPTWEFDSPTLISENGNYCLTYDNDRQVSVWDVTGKPLKLSVYKVAQPIYPVQINNAGDIILRDRKGKLFFGSVRRELLPTFSNSAERPSTFCLSDSTAHLATLLEGGKVNIWHTDGKILSTIKLPTDSAALWVKFSIDGKNLLILGGDQRLSLYETSGKHISDHWPHIDWRNTLNVAAFAPDGTEFAYITRDTAVQIVGVDGKLKQKLSKHTRPVTGVGYSAQKGFLVSVSLDSTAVVWRSSGTDYKPFSTAKFSAGVTSVEFNVDGKYFITACGEKAVEISNLMGKADSLVNQEMLKYVENPNARKLTLVSHVRFSGKNESLVLTYRQLNVDTMYLEDETGKFNMSVKKSFSTPIAQYAHGLHDHGFSLLGTDHGLQVIDLSPTSSLNVQSKEMTTGDILLNSGLSKVLTLNGRMAKFSCDGKRLYYIDEEQRLNFLPVDPKEILRLLNDEKIFGNKRILTEEELLEFGF